MNVGWHYLSDDDTSTPMAATTFLDIAGATVGKRSPEMMCRPYFKGQPELHNTTATACIWTILGARIQFGNELNNPIEQYPGTVKDYLMDYRIVNQYVKDYTHGGKVYWSPPSPSIDNWQQWLDGAEEADGIVVHCYGNFNQMADVVGYIVDRFPSKSIWIGECNFGPGPNKYVDLEQWAYSDLAPFLTWCGFFPNIEAVCYFAYRWPSPDMQLGTSVDGANTAVEEVLREWTQMNDPRIDQLLHQNAELTAAMISHLKGNDWRGADSTAGHIIALTGKTLEQLGLTPPKA